MGTCNLDQAFRTGRGGTTNFVGQNVSKKQYIPVKSNHFVFRVNKILCQSGLQPKYGSLHYTRDIIHQKSD